MIKESGGNGRYQTQVNILMIFVVCVGYFILHALPWLLYVPEFACYQDDKPMEGFSCVPQNFCNNPSITHEVVAGNGALHNWLTEFNMVCINQQVILGFYLLMFTGIAIGGLFFSPLVDHYGK